MMIRKTVTTLFCLFLVAAAFAGDHNLVTETFDETFAMSENGKVSLDNINGDVTVEVWDEATVRVQAEKKASTYEILELLKVNVDASGSDVTIDTDYPNSRSISRDRGTSMTVTYVLTVPRTAEINKIDLINGSITIEGVQGGVRAESINGSIRTKNVAGDIRLSTINGAIKPVLDTLVGVERIELDTVNGSVELALGASSGVSLEVETVNGSISNDFGIRVNKHKYVGADMRGDIGGGGIQVSIDTVNGSVEVNQR